MIKEVLDNKVSLLQFLKKAYPLSLSNKTIKQALEKGCCTVNGKIERFASIKLFAQDVVSFKYNPSVNKKAKKPTVLFEDEYFYVIDKPVDLLSSQKSMQDFFPGSYLVHRLDKPTTGCMIIAKSLTVQKKFIDLFKNKKIKKTYYACVDKKVKGDKGVIKSYLYRKGYFQGQTIWASNPQGKGLYAETHWEKIAVKEDYSIIKCTPITGRTHQLRVHMKEMGHPILKDAQYCRSFFSKLSTNRLLLHAAEISFEHPFTNSMLTVSSTPTFTQ
ncbi:MAG: RluA family pseudouridine synthase [Chlamydiota bacterium]|jgi:RluA family pseudouridine synthase